LHCEDSHKNIFLQYHIYYGICIYAYKTNKKNIILQIVLEVATIRLLYLILYYRTMLKCGMIFKVPLYNVGKLILIEMLYFHIEMKHYYVPITIRTRIQNILM